MAKLVGFILVLLVVAVATLWLFGVVELPGLGRFERGRGESASGPTLGAEGGETEASRLAGRGDEAQDGAASREAPATPEALSEVRGTAEKGGSIRGRVVREPGAMPVAGARVLLRRPDSILRYLRASAKGRYDLLEARTGKDGRFEFRELLPANEYVVRASVPPGPVVSSKAIDLRGRIAKDVGDLVLGATGRIEGRVVDTAGKPVGDARVAVSWPVVNPMQIVLADPETLEEIERDGRTKEDGTYAIDGLETGEKTVVVSSAHAGSNVLFDVGVVAGEATALGDTVLGGERLLAGRVENEDGSPVPGARVYAAQMGNRVVRTSESAADGTFRIEHLPAGKYRIGILVAGVPAKVSDKEYEAGVEDVVITFASAGSVEGRVVEKSSGAPVRRFTVRIDGGPGNFLEKYVRTLMDNTLGGQPVESAEGRFRIDHAFPGTMRVFVTAEGFPDTKSEPFEVVAGGKTDVRVELPAGHGARGIVRLPSGAPAPGADVYVATATEQIQERDGEATYTYSFDREPDAVADDDGRFTLPPQTPGKYEILATADDQLPATKDVDLTRPGTAEIEIRFPPSGTIEGTVLDEAGRPAPKAHVVVFGAGGAVDEREADEHGTFRLTAQPVGAAIVRWKSLRMRNLHGGPAVDDTEDGHARYESLRREGGEIQVRAGDTTRVEVRMPRLTRWTGRLLPAPEAQGGRWRGFYVALEGGSGQFVTLGEAGRFTVMLEPGKYSVWTPDLSGQWTSSEITIPADRDLEADVNR